MSNIDSRSGNSINLAKDFPQIEDITGVVKINLSFGGSRVDSYPFTESNLPLAYVECESPVCNHGGISLANLFRELLTKMVRDREVDGSLSKRCQGYEKMGERQTKRCKALYISITAHIQYKGAEINKAE